MPGSGVVRSLIGADGQLLTRHDFPRQRLSSVGLFPRNVCGCRQLWRLIRRRYYFVVKLIYFHKKTLIRESSNKRASSPM
jgi:hypothetical protein